MSNGTTSKRFYPKKITVKEINLSTEMLESIAESNGKGKGVPVARIYGRISRVEQGSSQYGPYSRYYGEFEAVNLIDSTVHRSQQLIVPAVGEAMVAEMLAAGRKDNKDAVVQVGFDVSVKFYDNPNKSGTKFKFECSPLVDNGEDALTLMGKSFGAMPMLGAPAAPAAEDTKKDSKKK